MSILIWLPLALIVGAYTCSWPVVPKLGIYIVFDGTAFLVAIGLPAVWLFHHVYAQTDNPEVLETRQWMSLLFPYWLTVIGVPTLTAIAILRHFIFRRRSHFGSDSPSPQNT